MLRSVLASAKAHIGHVSPSQRPNPRLAPTTAGTQEAHVSFLNAFLESPNPSNAAVLKCAKQVRRGILQMALTEPDMKKMKRVDPFLAQRDNLALYARLVRIQHAAYHATATVRKEGEGKLDDKDLKEGWTGLKFFANSAGVRNSGSPNGDINGHASSMRRANRPNAFSGSAKKPEANTVNAAHASEPQPEKIEGWMWRQFSSSKQEESKTGQNATAGSGANAKGGAENASAENPLHVYIVPSRWNWVGWMLTLLLIGTVLYTFNASGGGGGGPLASLLSNRFEFVEPSDLSFDDVKGNAEAKEELLDVVEYLKDPEGYAKLGIKIPKGILLTGPPGTGKTMLARVVASESGVPFVSTSGAEFEEMLVGVGARRVRQLFEMAKKNAPCIVFIDEIDAVGARRDDMTNGHHRMSINQLLVEMDGFAPNEGIVVIGATNLSEVLDPALIRPGRFDRKVTMELPDPKARKEILDHYLKDKKPDVDVSTGVLARAAAGFSGADLETMVNWAAIIAQKQKSAIISMKMLEEALFNVAMGRERKSLVLNEHTRELCAYHEGGHALASIYTPGSLDIRRATLVPRGDALGMVNYLTKEDSPLTTKTELLAEMDTAMAGRAAEELIYGDAEITQGAGSDFEHATNVATDMVMRMGMSPRIGPHVFSRDHRAAISPETRLIIEEETRRLLKESYDRASNLLRTHEDELHLLAKALLKYESLTVDEIKRAIKGDPLLEKESELQINKDLDAKLAAERAAEKQKRKDAADKRRAKAKQSAEAEKPDEQVKVNLAGKN